MDNFGLVQPVDGFSQRIVARIADAADGGFDTGFRVGCFVEKPDADKAQQYVEAGDYEWNSGMFLFKASRYLEELRQHAPKMHAASKASLDMAKSDLDFVRIDKDAFAASPDNSIDYAVMEKTTRAAVLPVSCAWSDIGSWDALWAASEHDHDGKRLEGGVIAIDSRNCFVRGTERRLVAFEASLFFRVT